MPPVEGLLISDRVKWTKRVLVGLVVAAAVAGLWLQGRVSGSLPTLDGALPLPGLQANVTIARDAAGVATLTGTSRRDVARATGFVHAQERFFQMDLMRRRAAGELAELLGAGALPLDRRHRLHRMRARAREVVEASSDDERALLDAYVRGVNGGLEALGAPPFEYLLLRAEPAAWREEDTVLVILSMFFELNDDAGSEDATRGLVRETLPEPLASFLMPPGTEWDAPILGDGFATPPIPGPDVLDLRGAPARAARVVFPDPARESVGSNSWAVAASRTAGAGALLANDMHLGHAVPNIWYRAVLEWPGARVVGVTLPGTPSMVVGSNGFVAWGFTNSNGDWVDLVELTLDPTEPGRYRTPDGWRAIEERLETLEVRGGTPETLRVRETIWGPAIEGARAIRWIAHDVDAVNLKLGGLETARSVEEALDVAARSGIPPQNFLCVDRSGSIAWTIAGRIPRRAGLDGRRPTSWADGSARWDGYLEPSAYPRVVDPPSGILWTANARVVSSDGLATVGDGGYALGARAKQIRDDLFAIEGATEEDMLNVQLDDRALFLSRWRELFLEIAKGREELAELRSVLEAGWTGRASIDSAAYRAVKELRAAVRDEVLSALLAPALEKEPRFGTWALRQSEGPLWKLVTERPPHLVPPPYESWDAALAGIVAKRVASWERPLEGRTWGEANRSEVRHPLSRFVPVLSRYLDMASDPLPGDTDMPRVQSPTHGASERLVVSPGREKEGIFHMPGGQSGHPLAPYYGAGHEDWERGRSTPLLPGETVYELTLTPG